MITVTYVTLTENLVLNHYAHAQTNNTLVKTEHVSHVTTNVKFVYQPILVMIVKTSEKEKIVTAQLDTMITESTPNVNNVYQNVLNVKMVRLVPYVLLKDSQELNLIAHAQKDNMKPKTLAMIVMSNVNLVLELQEIVMNVLETEKMHQHVVAQMVLMKLVKKYAQTVMKIV